MVTPLVPLRRILFIALGFALVVSRPAFCQQAHLYAHIDNGPTACHVNIAAGIHTASIYVVASQPFNGVEFSAPLPAGLVHIGESSFYVATGSSQTGVQVAIPDCQTAPPAVEVLRIHFFAPAALNDVTWTMEPAQGQETIRLVDCTETWMKGSSEYSIYCDEGGFVGPYKPSPADGATDVPLDQLLSFVGPANVVVLGTTPQLDYDNELCSVFATNPPKPCSFPLDPGGLLPNTTYYWKAYNACVGCYHGEHGASDLWSFTTADVTVSVTKSTWGRIKAMYRE